MDMKILYEFLKDHCDRDNYEQVSDSYGNSIESFLVLDDLAICFSFNNNDELLNCWFCQKARETK